MWNATKLQPNGAVCFIFNLFEGSISGVDIIDQCGILQQINSGDALLLENGFTIQHILLTNQAAIFISPFLGKRDTFTKEEVMLTKRIAKAKIQVERFNERLKRFRTLHRVIPLTLYPIAFQMVYVASCIINFQQYLCVWYWTRKMLWCKHSTIFINSFFPNGPVLYPLTLSRGMKKEHLEVNGITHLVFFYWSF